ncbi:phosphatidylinositol phosphate synthase [Arcanobacterium bovis]|uniref:Phosphatidylinositol phosphate synthase n=1 Tax=Arcanobacterium bovis TaxID=2529275 RepID=A0A4Q9V1F4_9ACTO|nr:CDP-alcohol phosphatidyltransferase family protein [Arcanobacterium bovis]TBW22873.1 CDP-alcohol phosphatidyltransferase family protein [Arcanobacterium bovis]
MLSRSGRPLAQIIFGPIARACVKLGVSANTITVVGTVMTIAASLYFFPRNHLLIGTLIVTILVIFDNLDGQVARLTNTSSIWGAFLDSTMDRFADAAIFASFVAWGYTSASEPTRIWVMTGALAALIFGSIVPYARARAEGVGLSASVGIAERADRLVFAGICVLLVGFGLSHWIMAVGMWILALLAFITVIQRMHVVYQQCKLAPNNQ